MTKRKTQSEHVRTMAITLVDGAAGYTMEFASSPAYHRDKYDEAEQAISIALEINHLKIVNKPST